MKKKILKSKLWAEHEEIERQIRQLTLDRMRIEEKLIELFCPYRPGDKVIYIKNIRLEPIIERHGIIKKISFSMDGVDDMWSILITPTNGRFDVYDRKFKVYLSMGDKIKTIE